MARVYDYASELACLLFLLRHYLRLAKPEGVCFVDVRISKGRGIKIVIKYKRHGKRYQEAEVR